MCELVVDTIRYGLMSIKVLNDSNKQVNNEHGMAVDSKVAACQLPFLANVDNRIRILYAMFSH